MQLLDSKLTLKCNLLTIVTYLRQVRTEQCSEHRTHVTVLALPVTSQLVSRKSLTFLCLGFLCIK